MNEVGRRIRERPAKPVDGLLAAIRMHVQANFFQGAVHFAGLLLIRVLDETGHPADWIRTLPFELPSFMLEELFALKKDLTTSNAAFGCR